MPPSTWYRKSGTSEKKRSSGRYLSNSQRFLIGLCSSYDGPFTSQLTSCGRTEGWQLSTAFSADRVIGCICRTTLDAESPRRTDRWRSRRYMHFQAVLDASNGIIIQLRLPDHSRNLSYQHRPEKEKRNRRGYCLHAKDPDACPDIGLVGTRYDFDV
jgi:hypothetical protein